MPPVSLPLNGGTWPARAGGHTSIPHPATRLRTPIIRIANSIAPGETLKRNRRHGKDGRRLDAQFSPSVAALHLTSCVCRYSSRRRPNPFFGNDFFSGAYC